MTRKGHFAVRYRHVDIRGVDPAVIGEAVVDVFQDARIGTLVVLRPAAAMVVRLAALLGVFVTEPRRNLVHGLVPEVAPALGPAALAAAIWLAARPAALAGLAAIVASPAGM